MEKIEWFIPFHIQLLVQELIDGYFDTGKPVDETTVDSAFSKVAGMRNDIYFAHYYSRLKKTFDDSEYPFVLTLLDELTRSDQLSLQEIKGLASRHGLENYGIVLRTLASDGYIFKNESFYRFTSPVLRLWWRNDVKVDNALKGKKTEEDVIDSIVLTELEIQNRSFQDYLEKRDYLQAAKIANAAYEICEKIIKILDQNTQRDIYQKIVALSEYWKLNRDLYALRRDI